MSNTKTWDKKYTVSPGWGDRKFDIDVEVYADAETMLSAAGHYGPFEDGTDGICHCFTDGTEPVALIRLHRGKLDIGVIAHEASHAAVHIAGVLTKRPQKGDGEIIPWFVGELTTAIHAAVSTLPADPKKKRCSGNCDDAFPETVDPECPIHGWV